MVAAYERHCVAGVGSMRCARRQPDRKDRTLAELARHGHVATHHARELAG